MKLIKNVRLYGEICDVAVEDGKIASIGKDLVGEGEDFGGAKIYPGLIDVHSHGAVGVDTMDCDLAPIARYELESGITTWYPTTMTMSEEDGSLVSEPEILTRGFVYLKEADSLLGELKRVVYESIMQCESQRITDWSSIKGKVKGNLSGYLYKTTKRSPMILPVIIEV